MTGIRARRWNMNIIFMSCWRRMIWGRLHSDSRGVVFPSSIKRWNSLCSCILKSSEISTWSLPGHLLVSWHVSNFWVSVVIPTRLSIFRLLDQTHVWCLSKPRIVSLRNQMKLFWFCHFDEKRNSSAPLFACTVIWIYYWVLIGGWAFADFWIKNLPDSFRRA